MRRLPSGKSNQLRIAPLVDHFREFAHVGNDRQVGMMDAAQFVGVRVDMDQRLAGMVGSDERVAIGRGLAEPGADGQQQIGVADALLQPGVGAIAQLAGIDAAFVVDRVLAAEGGGDGDAVAEGEIGEMVRRARAPVRAADDGDRRGGFLEQFEQSGNRAWIGRFAQRRHRWPVDRLDLVTQHVLGNGQHHRPRSAGGGDAIRPRDIFGNAPGIVDPRRPFGDGTEESRKVDLLEALAVLVGARQVADEQDQRRRILEGDMDSGAGVGGAGPAGHEGDSRPPGHLAVGVGHVGDAAFLPADDDIDLGRVKQRVEDGEEALARHGENAVAALGLELIDEDAATAALGHAGALNGRAPDVTQARKYP